MRDRWSKAYTEVLEIISYFSYEEYSKIPRKQIEFFRENMDRDYQYKINPEIDLAQQEISEEANAIIIKLFLDYFATDYQKQGINEILMKNQ